MEQKKTWVELVDGLAKQRQEINVGDVFNFATATAFTALIYNFGFDVLKKVGLNDNQKSGIVNELIEAKTSSNFLDKLAKNFIVPEWIDEAKAIIESIGKDAFKEVILENGETGFTFNTDRIEKINELKDMLNKTPKGMMGVIHNIDENLQFMGGTKGLAITIGVIAGVATLVNTKLQVNEMLRGDIMMIQNQVIAEAQENTHAEMVRLREAIEKTKETEQTAQR